MIKLKNHANGIILCLFELVVGILLMINPIGFTTGIITAAGIVLLVIGLISVIKYICAEPLEARVGQYLLKGLVALAAGGFCVFRSQWFLITFPALTILYGIAVLLAGLSKVQTAFDLFRIKNRRWIICILSALLSVICALVILRNPFTSTTVLWMFTGISLVVESVIDIIVLIMNRGSAIF